MTKRWGILGTGRIARKFVQALAEATDAEAYAIASRDLARATTLAQELSIPQAYGAYTDLLHDPAVDYIYNALPNTLHAEWSIKAVQAGKHVLCEKPLASSTAEAEAMFAAAQGVGIWLMEGFMYRFHPQILKVQELLAAGAIGTLRLIRSSFGFTVTDAANVRLSAELAGGALMDVGCYCVNFARMVAGSAPIRVSAVAQWSDTGVDTTLAGTLEYPGGILAQVACSLATSRHHTAQVIGSDGIIEVAEPFTPPFDQPTVVRLYRGTNVAAVEEISIPPANHFRLEAEGFDRLVRDGHGNWPEMPAAETLDNMATIEALLRSARANHPIALGS